MEISSHIVFFSFHPSCLKGNIPYLKNLKYSTDLPIDMYFRTQTGKDVVNNTVIDQMQSDLNETGNVSNSV